MKKTLALLIGLVVLVASLKTVFAEEVNLNNQFLSGRGLIEMYIQVVSDPSEILYVGNSVAGSKFKIDSFRNPGYLELHMDVPMMMWSGVISVGDRDDISSVILGNNMTVSSSLVSSTTLFTPPSVGSIKIDTFHRRDDGVVDLISGHFYQPHVNGTDISYQYGYVHFEIPHAPEPSSTVLTVIGSMLLARKKSRRY